MINENLITIENQELQIKEWKSQRVITFKDIDRIHQRPEGTASRNFKTNRKHLIENEDYFIIKPSDILKDEFRPLGFNEDKPSNRGTIYLTEMGYLMIVKSLTDDLAWKVQRQLVNSYFKVKENNLLEENNLLNLHMKTLFAQINNMETLVEQQDEKINSLLNNVTISYEQQQELQSLVKTRICKCYGISEWLKKHQKEYVNFTTKSVAKRIWLNVCKHYNLSSYRNINPNQFEDVKSFIMNIDLAFI